MSCWRRTPQLDAMFAASDLMAAGALRALRAAGRRVPDDVAVIGFDDSELARNTDPLLTSVSQPTQQMGRELAKLLIAQLRDPDTKLSPGHPADGARVPGVGLTRFWRSPGQPKYAGQYLLCHLPSKLCPSVLTCGRAAARLRAQNPSAR